MSQCPCYNEVPLYILIYFIRLFLKRFSPWHLLTSQHIVESSQYSFQYKLQEGLHQDQDDKGVSYGQLGFAWTKVDGAQWCVHLHGFSTMIYATEHNNAKVQLHQTVLSYLGLSYMPCSHFLKLSFPSFKYKYTNSKNWTIRINFRGGKCRLRSTSRINCCRRSTTCAL